MKEGIIEPNSEFGRELGFTSDKFDGWLWKFGNWIYISFIRSKQKRQGNFSSLLHTISQCGFGIKVPNPSGLMKKILQEKRFKQIEEYDELMRPVEIWIRR